jgi:hypothetical protein
MKRDLEQLLLDADVLPSSASRHALELDRLVRATYDRRRRRRRIAGCGGAALALVAIALAAASIDRSPRTIAIDDSMPQPARVAVSFKPEPAMSGVMIDVHERSVAIAMNEINEAKKPPVRKAVDLFEQQRDRAALILIYDAEQYLQQNRHDDAVAMYRRAVELFPQSQWAEVARQWIQQHAS